MYYAARLSLPATDKPCMFYSLCLRNVKNRQWTVFSGGPTHLRGRNPSRTVHFRQGSGNETRKHDLRVDLRAIVFPRAVDQEIPGAGLHEGIRVLRHGNESILHNLLQNVMPS